jgi:hypothetical protein
MEITCRKTKDLIEELMRCKAIKVLLKVIEEEKEEIQVLVSFFYLQTGTSEYSKYCMHRRGVSKSDTV